MIDRVPHDPREILRPSPLGFFRGALWMLAFMLAFAALVAGCVWIL